MRLFQRFFDVIILLVTVLALATAVAFIYFQSSLLVVTSASMEPSFKPGDTLLVRSVETSQIKKFDVVVLPIPDVEGLRFSHRVISEMDLLQVPNSLLMPSRVIFIAISPTPSSMPA